MPQILMNRHKLRERKVFESRALRRLRPETTKLMKAAEMEDLKPADGTQLTQHLHICKLLKNHTRK